MIIAGQLDKSDQSRHINHKAITAPFFNIKKKIRVKTSWTEMYNENLCNLQELGLIGSDFSLQYVLAHLSCKLEAVNYKPTTVLLGEPLKHLEIPFPFICHKYHNAGIVAMMEI